MGNQHGHATQEREIPTGDQHRHGHHGHHDAHSHEQKGEEATTMETETIDKYQVVEDDEKALEVSTLANDAEASGDMGSPAKSEGKDKDALYVDIEEVAGELKLGEKSPLMKSPKYEEMKEKALDTPVNEENEKPSDVTVGERDLLLEKGVSGDESVGSGLGASNEKVANLTRKDSLFKNFLCCIQGTNKS